MLRWSRHFTIEDESDAGDDIPMKYRYLDLRRNPVRNTLILRAKMAHAVRSYLNSNDFIETETPVLIKSTPEGPATLWCLRV
jgi:aspartyl-tRNA synthetase